MANMSFTLQLFNTTLKTRFKMLCTSENEPCHKTIAEVLTDTVRGDMTVKW